MPIAANNLPWRYFRLEGAAGDQKWPEDQDIQPGAIIRRNNLRRAEMPGGAVWNEKTKDWVFAVWTEVEDPALATATSPNALPHQEDR